MEIEQSFFLLLIPLLLIPLIILSRQNKKKTKKIKKKYAVTNNYFPGLLGAIIVGGIFLVIFAFTSGETVFWIIAAPVALIFFLSE